MWLFGFTLNINKYNQTYQNTLKMMNSCGKQKVEGTGDDMGEKVYRPIIKEGDHLVKSKENEGRVRGVSQDSNNKTTDIIDWEEIEIESQEDYYKPERV